MDEAISMYIRDKAQTPTKVTPLSPILLQVFFQLYILFVGASFLVAAIFSTQERLPQCQTSWMREKQTLLEGRKNLHVV